MKKWRIAGIVVIVLIIALVIVGINLHNNATEDEFDDGIKQVDLDTIYFKDSSVTVHFSDVILSSHNETRKLIVSEQEATVSTDLTDKIIEVLDFAFLKKTQSVHYTATGYFVVNLDKLSSKSIVEDKDKKIITIKIPHATLETIEIDPSKVVIDGVQEGFLARGDIKMTLGDFNNLSKELQDKLYKEFDTVENGQKADDNALRMVKEVFEPAVKAVDNRYSVNVEFE